MIIYKYKNLESDVIIGIARGCCHRAWLLAWRIVAAIVRYCWHRSLLLRWPVVPASLVVSSIVYYCWHCSLSLASFVVLLVRHIVAAIVRG